MVRQRTVFKGDRFGKLVAVQQKENYSWVCRCDCGNLTKGIETSDLTSGRRTVCNVVRHKDHVGETYGRFEIISQRDGDLVTLKCSKCFKIKELRYKNVDKRASKTCTCKRIKFEETKNINKILWKNIYHNAVSKRDLDFVISIQDADSKLVEQQFRCGLSGIHLSIPIYSWQGKLLNEGNASLDRIDSSIGYTKDNIHWVDKTINKMKGAFSLDRFFTLCKKVSVWNTNYPKLDIVEEKTHPSFTGYRQVHGGYLSSLRIGAKRRGIDFSLSCEDIWNQYEKQGGVCSLSGEKIKFVAVGYQRRKTKEQTASVDRINNSKGYNPRNIQIVHKDINRMRNAFSVKNFRKKCLEITNFQENGVK